MATYEIRIDVGADAEPQDLVVSLDAVTYVIRLRRNSRSSTWSLDLLDEGATALVAGLSLVTGHDLLQAHRALAGVPQGALVLLDADGTGTDPGELELGGRCQLYYVDAADLAALEAAAEAA